MTLSGPPKKPEIRLNPALQRELLAQMRAEQESGIRTRRLKRYLMFAGLIGFTWASLLMTFSPDSTTSMLGSTAGSSALLLVWKLRKRLAAIMGLS